MKAVLSAAEAKASEQAAFESGIITPFDAMTNAAKAVADRASAFDRVLVLCGGGNNGGDGFAAAVFLHAAGKRVSVCFYGDEAKLSGHAARYFKMAAPLIVNAPEENYDCVIDALTGTGFTPPLRGSLKEAFAVLKRFENKAYILAVDLPGGLSADGDACEEAVPADGTVTFMAPKRACFLRPDLCGSVTVANIGIEPNGSVLTPEKADIRALLPVLSPRRHKGTAGFAGVVASSRGMEGAGDLCALSALRCGCGKAALSVPSDCLGFFDGRAPEVMVQPRADLTEFIRGKDVLVFGPGLGRGEDTKQLLHELAAVCEVPVVLDADGLYYATAELLKSFRCPVLITPHLGEAARLFGVTVPALAASPVEITGRFAAETGVAVLLKSHYNLVCAGENRYLSAWGCPGMATAGSGDVLAGIAAGCLLLTKDTEKAALLASYLHGCAGRAAEKELTAYAMTAADISARISAAFRSLLTDSN